MERNQNPRDNYNDIINLPHHVSSRHPQMPLRDRAAQFSPFAALTGYGDVIREAARTTCQKPELSEEERARLDEKLRIACSLSGPRPEIAVTYFVPDKKKSGGAYRTAAGRIKKIDMNKHSLLLEGGIEIPLDSILHLDSAADTQSGEDFASD